MLFYGIGQEAEGIKDTAFRTFLLFYYQQIVGVSGTLTGLALAIALCVDAITDPIAGTISDRTNTRFGRRHPFIVVSALPLAVTFYLLFNPPDNITEVGSFFWILTFAVLVRISLTFYHIPHLALGAELTDDPVQRSTLFTLSAFFRSAAHGGVPLLAYLLFFPTTEEFSPGLLNKDGYFLFAIFFACWMFLVILVSAAGTYSEIPYLKKAPQNLAKKWFSGYVEIKQALSNRAFRSLFSFFFIVALIAAVAGVFSPFMSFHFWGLSTENIALIIIMAGPGLFLSVFILPWLTSRFDKRNILIGCSVWIIFLNNWAIVLRLLDVSWFPENGSGIILAIVAFNTFLGAMVVPVIVSAGDSMMADITDEIDLETGQRREGVLFSSRAFTTKATGSLGLIIGGALLDVINFPENATTGTVDEDVIWQLGFVSGPMTSILMLLALYLLVSYPLTRSRFREISDALKVRDRGI